MDGKEPFIPSFRKIFLRALACAKEYLCGIRFGSFAAKEQTQIPYWRKTAHQFFKFGVVGVVGFIVDTAMLYFGINALGLGRIAAGMFSFPFSVTSTWIGNRLYTFRDAPPMPPAKQLAKFAFVCAIGIVFNRGTYSLLVSTIPFVYDYPVIGLLGGTAAGMFFNFFASRKHVFGA
jgi:putative flippase GtrA